MKQQVKNKAFQGMINKTLEIQKNQNNKEGEIRENLEKTLRAQEEARRVQDQAETEEEYFQACEEEKLQKQKEVFWKRRLDSYVFTPQINEKEYYDQIRSVEKFLEEKAEAYKQIVDKNMDEICAAQTDFVKEVREADRILAEFDEAAKFLQSKHRYEEFPRQNMPTVRRENPHEWKRYVTRFSGDPARFMATNKDGVPDKKLAEAWRAVERFYGTPYGTKYPFESLNDIIYG